jgi:hypothetical protein
VSVRGYLAADILYYMNAYHLLEEELALWRQFAKSIQHFSHKRNFCWRAFISCRTNCDALHLQHSSCIKERVSHPPVCPSYWIRRRKVYKYRVFYYRCIHFILSVIRIESVICSYIWDMAGPRSGVLMNIGKCTSGYIDENELNIMKNEHCIAICFYIILGIYLFQIYTNPMCIVKRNTSL